MADFITQSQFAPVFSDLPVIALAYLRGIGAYISSYMLNHVQPSTSP